MNTVSPIENKKNELGRDVYRLARLSVRYIDFEKGGILVHHGLIIILGGRCKDKIGQRSGLS